MTANDVDEWISYAAATTIYWGTVVKASPAGTTQELLNTTASSDIAIGVAMVTASIQGDMVPVAVSGVVLIKCQSTAATFGVPAVCCATVGQVRSAEVGPLTGATTAAQMVGVFAETFTGNTIADKVKVLLRPGRR